MILQRYIGLSVVGGWMLVLAVIAAVFGLLTFIEQLERVGGPYDALAASWYTLRMLPNQLVSLAPVIALLGTIMALANMDRHKELTVISAAGFGRGKLLSAVLLPTFLLMASLWAAMEYVTPQLQRAAEQERLRLRHGDTDRLPNGGLWSTDGRRYMHLLTLSEDGVPGRISLFEFNGEGRLVRALKARKALVEEDRSWLFQNVREKILVDGELRTRHHEELAIDNLWSPDELPNLSLEGDTMHLSLLYDYARYLQRNRQPAERYMHTLWQKLFMPFTVLAMVLLATPISASVTAGRDRSLGLNIGIGALVGVIFYLGAQIVFALGRLLDWSIPLVAALPALIILTVALTLLSRMRW